MTSKDEATEHVMKLTALLDASQKEAEAIEARREAIHALIDVMSKPDMRILMRTLMDICNEDKLQVSISRISGPRLGVLQEAIFLAASLSLAIAYENPDMVPVGVKP